MSRSADAISERCGAVLVASVSAASLAAAIMFGGPPSDSSSAAALFPPWWSQEQVILAADDAGDLLAVGRLPFIVAVANKDRPVAEQLRASGALVLLSASAAGCT